MWAVHGNGVRLGQGTKLIAGVIKSYDSWRPELEFGIFGNIKLEIGCESLLKLEELSPR